MIVTISDYKIKGITYQSPASASLATLFTGRLLMLI